MPANYPCLYFPNFASFRFNDKKKLPQTIPLSFLYDIIPFWNAENIFKILKLVKKF